MKIKLSSIVLLTFFFSTSSFAQTLKLGDVFVDVSRNPIDFKGGSKPLSTVKLLPSEEGLYRIELPADISLTWGCSIEQQFIRSGGVLLTTRCETVGGQSTLKLEGCDDTKIAKFQGSKFTLLDKIQMSSVIIGDSKAKPPPGYVHEVVIMTKCTYGESSFR